MFEVGKKYKLKDSEVMRNVAMTCLFVGERATFFSTDQFTGHTWAHNKDAAESYIEVPPEPKRWSTWQNVYSKEPYRDFGAALHHVSLAHAALDSAPHTRGEKLGILRRDYEQHAGEVAVCVKLEVEK